MTDEEKKAIELLKEFKENGFHLLNLKYESRVSTTKHIENSIGTILKLIEKQQKEIEKLKEDNKKKSIVIIEYQDLYEKLIDKIEAKIEEYKRIDEDEFVEQGTFDNEITVLQSLLEKE